MTIVVIDTETTGFGHTKGRVDAIIQVGICWRDWTGEMRTWEQKCLPPVKFLENGRADDALRVNGITLAELGQCEPDSEVAWKLRHQLRMIPDITLRSYNMQFDRPFLDINPWALGQIPWGKCIMEEAKNKLNPGGKWLKLRDACQRVDIIADEEKLHSAAYDAQLAYLLMEKLNV